MSTTLLAIFGLRGQLGSFLAQTATLPMPQPHSQLRSFNACMAVVFWPALRPSQLSPATPVSSADFIQPDGNSVSAL
jgi:hypothetical protein